MFPVRIGVRGSVSLLGAGSWLATVSRSSYRQEDFIPVRRPRRRTAKAVKSAGTVGLWTTAAFGVLSLVDPVMAMKVVQVVLAVAEQLESKGLSVP